MVDFWYNHFNVFSGKGQDRALVASYERDAIRPYVFGSFRQMLGATAHHPAMLFYLDNWVSKAGGLNENYARELMELHTLGVDGGYTQKDVTELAPVSILSRRSLAEIAEDEGGDVKKAATGDPKVIPKRTGVKRRKKGAKAKVWHSNRAS